MNAKYYFLELTQQESNQLVKNLKGEISSIIAVMKLRIIDEPDYDYTERIEKIKVLRRIKNRTTTYMKRNNTTIVDVVKVKLNAFEMRTLHRTIGYCINSSIHINQIIMDKKSDFYSWDAENIKQNDKTISILISVITKIEQFGLVKPWQYACLNSNNVVTETSICT